MVDQSPCGEVQGNLLHSSVLAIRVSLEEGNVENSNVPEHWLNLTQHVVGLEMSRGHDQAHAASPGPSAYLEVSCFCRDQSGHLDRDYLVEEQQIVHADVF